jgi:hypothetical protein
MSQAVQITSNQQYPTLPYTGVQDVTPTPSIESPKSPRIAAGFAPVSRRRRYPPSCRHRHQRGRRVFSKSTYVSAGAGRQSGTAPHLVLPGVLRPNLPSHRGGDIDETRGSGRTARDI